MNWYPRANAVEGRMVEYKANVPLFSGERTIGSVHFCRRYDSLTAR